MSDLATPIAGPQEHIQHHHLHCNGIGSVQGLLAAKGKAPIILMLGLLTLAMLASSLVPAYADPLPDVYLGLWCFQSGTNGLVEYYTKGSSYGAVGGGDRNCPKHEYITINRNGYELNEQGCKFFSIKHTGKKAAASTQARSEDYIVVIRIVARCTGEGDGKPWIEKRELIYGKGTLTSKLLGELR